MPLDNYISYKLVEYRRQGIRQRSQLPNLQKRQFIEEEGLTAKDWATIAEYQKILQPFKEATTCMEGRGVAGTSGAIWEVLPTLNWLATTLNEMLFQYVNVDFNDVDAPEDHIQATCNMAYIKILKYMRKLKDTPAYYAACRLHPRMKGYMDKV